MGEKISELTQNHPSFHLMLILYHQILMNVKTILIFVMVANVPTFLESIAVCVMMASWLQWTWKHASVGTIKVDKYLYTHTHTYPNIGTFMHAHTYKHKKRLFSYLKNSKHFIKSWNGKFIWKKILKYIYLSATLHHANRSYF